MATSKPKKAKLKISASESASGTLNPVDISNTLRQLATAINDFLGASAPPVDVRDDLSKLQSQLRNLANTNAVDAIAAALKDLEEPREKIANFTTKIKTAIQAIEGRDTAFKTLATVVEALTKAVDSGNPQGILDVFNQ